MKILLINPNPRGYPDVGEIVRSVPLGLLYVAAALRQAGYGPISIVDAKVNDLDHKEVLARIKNFAPDLAGIGGMHTDAREIHALARLIKESGTHCKIVVGGAYASSSPETVIKDPNIDFVVSGEGEVTICELAGALEKGHEVSGIDSLAFKNGGVALVNSRRAEIVDIDSIPFPAWDLVDMEKYFSSAYRTTGNPIPVSRRLIPLFTSRGCPYGCVYCHNIFGKKPRFRSVESVLREIELLVERYAPGEIEILDDIFNLDLVRAKRICDEIIKRGIKIRLSFLNGLRVDGMDEELIVKLKEAGTYYIGYAIESASSGVQERIGKELDLKKAREIIHLTVNRGIIICGYFMIGFPEETKEEILETIKFAKELPFHFANFSYVTPWLNTPLHALLKKKNMVLENTALCYHHKLSINLTTLTDAGLKRMWARAYAEFYLRPAQMWRIWNALPDKGHILRDTPSLLKRCIP